MSPFQHAGIRVGLEFRRMLFPYNASRFGKLRRLVIAASFLVAFVVPAAAAAQAGAQAAPHALAPPSNEVAADPQFDAAKNFVSFYTFNRLAYKQVCDKQAVDVGTFVTTFVSENAGAYAKAMSVLQAHGISEAKVMTKLQATIASSEPDVRKALEDSAARENAGSTTLDGCNFLASHGEKLARDLDMRKSHPEVIQALNGNARP